MAKRNFKVIENQTSGWVTSLINPPEIMDGLVGISVEDTLDQIDSLLAYIEYEMIRAEKDECIPEDAADGKQYAKRVLIGAARNALQKQSKQLGGNRAVLFRSDANKHEAHHG